MDDLEANTDVVYVEPLFTISRHYMLNVSPSKTLRYHTRYQKMESRCYNANIVLDFECKLFVDNIWPGSLVLADYIIDNPNLVLNSKCVEFGAGCALPSMVASCLNAELVVSTDYPAPYVIENIEILFKNNGLVNCYAVGHVWGEDCSSILNLSHTRNYDIILLAELLWKDTYNQHDCLLRSATQCLSPNGFILLALTHRPTQTHTCFHDLEFFDKAYRHYGLQCDRLFVCSKYNDPGETLPAEVSLYKLYRCS